MINISDFLFVESLVYDMMFEQWSYNGSYPTSEQCLKDIRVNFDREGPYFFAKNRGLLVNNSGEEFAIQFMTVYNSIYPGTY